MARTLVIEVYDNWDAHWDQPPRELIQVPAVPGVYPTKLGDLQIDIARETANVLRVNGIWFDQLVTINLMHEYDMGTETLTDGRHLVFWKLYEGESPNSEKNFLQRMGLANKRRKVTWTWLPDGRNAI